MATQGKEYKLAIRIAGTIDKSLPTSLKTTESKLNATAKKINSSFTQMDKGFDSIMNTGQKCLSVITTAAGVTGAAIAAATVMAVNAGSDFESAFAGVKKTVDATEEEYAILRQNILDMSTEIPSSASEIAGVMEIAGQLGIATGSLTDFTKVMINLGVSTNLSAEEAATALAKFANVVGMSDFDEYGISNYERLGSVIVDLGNKFATTEADIVTMATRLASTGDIVGLSEAQIMALATAMSSVGIQAEVGGSTMSKLLRQIQVAVETGSGSLEEYASVANMTVDEFSNAFKNDAVSALAAFLSGLNDTERNGKSAIAVLNDMDIKEIRLTNTILALANASGVMSDAIDTANRAWNENTALAIEAGKRYETVESQAKIMKNALTNLGIAAYDELREPLVDSIDFVTEKIEGLNTKVSGANGVSKWIRDISTTTPTLKRKIEKPLTTVFNVLTSIGTWCVKNKSVVIGTIEGIGTALVTYKIASTISHIVAAVTSSGLTLALTGITVALTGLTSAFFIYKNYEKELVNKSLSEHFGDIALSMQELQRVAEYIVSSKSLSAVQKSLDAFSGLEELAATMESSTKTINKLNWEVSIGIKLNEDEQEEYKTAIDSYVKAAQDYALQSQYAVNLNMSVAFDDGYGGKEAITYKVNQFYQDKYNELSELGTKLNNAVTDAFNDGLLDIKETQAISNIQSKMAEIQQQLATSEFDAKLSVLQLDYSGTELTKDSFQNLQNEINNELETATQAYKDAYVKNFAAIKAARDAGEEYLNDDEYNSAIKALQDEYLQNVSELQQKAAEYQINTIKDSYSDAIGQWSDALDEMFGTEYADAWKDKPGAMWQQINDSMAQTLSKADRSAIKELVDALKPTMEEMQSTIDGYKEAGKEIPQALLDGMNDYELLLALSGDKNAVLNAVGDSIANTDKYNDILNMLEEQGSALPEQVATAIQENTDKAQNACTQLYSDVNGTLQHLFSKGLEVSANVKVNLNTIYDGEGNLTGPYSQSYIDDSKFSKLNLPGHADGGIFTKPHIAKFAERGMESAIPIDGSRRAVSIWEKTGKLLGLDFTMDTGNSLVSLWNRNKDTVENTYSDTSNNSNVTIEYKPTLQFYGDKPDEKELTSAMQISQSEFNKLMDNYNKGRGRIAFG